MSTLRAALRALLGAAVKLGMLQVDRNSVKSPPKVALRALLGAEGRSESSAGC